MKLIEYKPIANLLDNWEKDPTYGYMWGYLFNDTKARWPDGQRIRTSLIKGIRQTEYFEGMLVKTMNSNYTLGKKNLDT